MPELSSSAREDVLVFACAGGSNVGQLSNAVAVKLDQDEAGTLFCLAGIGGHVDSLVRKAQEAGHTVVIDGCPMRCATRILEHAGVEPSCHVVVTELGIEKTRNFELVDEGIQQVVDAVTSRMGDAAYAGTPHGCCAYK